MDIIQFLLDKIIAPLLVGILIPIILNIFIKKREKDENINEKQINIIN